MSDTKTIQRLKQTENQAEPPKLTPTPYSTVPLPDGIVIGGPWPFTIISWPGGKSRGATRPEHDLFQALEGMKQQRDELLEALKELVELEVARNMHKARAAIAKAEGH